MLEYAVRAEQQQQQPPAAAGLPSFFEAPGPVTADDLHQRLLQVFPAAKPGGAAATASFPAGYTAANAELLRHQVMFSYLCVGLQPCPAGAGGPQALAAPAPTLVAGARDFVTGLLPAPLSALLASSFPVASSATVSAISSGEASSTTWRPQALPPGWQQLPTSVKGLLGSGLLASSSLLPKSVSARRRLRRELLRTLLATLRGAPWSLRPSWAPEDGLCLYSCIAMATQQPVSAVLDKLAELIESKHAS